MLSLLCVEAARINYSIRTLALNNDFSTPTPAPKTTAPGIKRQPSHTPHKLVKSITATLAAAGF